MIAPACAGALWCPNGDLHRCCPRHILGVKSLDLHAKLPWLAITMGDLTGGRGLRWRLVAKVPGIFGDLVARLQLHLGCVKGNRLSHLSGCG